MRLPDQQTYGQPSRYSRNRRKKYRPGVTLYLLYEETDHPQLPRVKLATESALRKYEPACVTWDRGYPRGSDIGPLEGPSPSPSWTPFSMGTPTHQYSDSKNTG